MPLEDDLPSLREDLGEAGYRWLCACAVAPVLRWELTIHLGRTLAAADGREAPNETDCLALAHLSWFRQGRIPERIRRRLIDDLTPETLNLVRRTLRASFGREAKPASWTERMRRALRDAGRGISLSARLTPPAPSDPLFVDTMLGRQGGRQNGQPAALLRRVGIAPRGLLVPQVALPFLGALTLAGAAMVFSKSDGAPVARSVDLAGLEDPRPLVDDTVPLSNGAIYDLDMIVLPAGTAPDGTPVAPFAIGAYEVTGRLWAACVADGDCPDPNLPPNDFPIALISHAAITGDDPDGTLKGRGFLVWLNERTGGGYRLPSEAEWRYAAAANTTTRFFWGDDLDRDRVCDFAHLAPLDAPYPVQVQKAIKASGQKAEYDPAKFRCAEPASAGTAPVGERRPNAFGLYDTAGNVWEWVAASTEKNGAMGPIAVGGGWASAPGDLQTGSRRVVQAGFRDLDIGFRLARSVGQPAP
ncbi:MAG: formylglycine-generating enzyme family protein [Alphaproteobacteria bacterium]